MKVNDFKALKSLKKEMEKAEQPEAKVLNQPRRSRTVQLRSIDEEHARNIGIEKGQRVRMMDTNDSGTIVGFGKDFYEIEIDGLKIRAARGEFVLTNEEEDRKLYSSMPSAPKKHGDKKNGSGSGTSSTASNGECVVDLHFERIPGNENVPEWAALEYQMGYFRQIVRENLKHRGKRIVFIHGDGDGTLKAAIRKELDEVFALSCSYTYGSSDSYGTGATIVTIR